VPVWGQLRLPKVNDPYFDHNWLGMADAKLMRIAYHFAHPANDPDKEFNHFAARVPTFDPKSGTTVALDLETTQGRSPKDLVDFALRWGQLATDHYGVQPGLYTGAYFLRTNLNDARLVPMFWLWEAAYQKSPPNSAPWPKWTMWQFTSSGFLPGINGRCDISVGVPEFFHAISAPVTQEVIMARVPNATDACRIPGSVNGAWVVAGDGGVFTFGDGPFHGSLPGLGITPNGPVVGIVAHGMNGYWLVGADGGVFAFGDAPPLNTYIPFMAEYSAGVHAMLKAEASDDNHLHLIADDGARYEYIPS
jgi:GH25 family lysozyme M1 (1,4-beta-N-acetylmuramidase)